MRPNKKKNLMFTKISENVIKILSPPNELCLFHIFNVTITPGEFKAIN